MGQDKKTKDQELALLRAKLKTIKKMVEEYELLLPSQFYFVVKKILESN